MIRHLRLVMLWFVFASGVTAAIAAAGLWVDSRTSDDGAVCPLGSAYTAGLVSNGQTIWVGVERVHSLTADLIHRRRSNAYFPDKSFAGFGWAWSAGRYGYAGAPAWAVIATGVFTAAAAAHARRRHRAAGMIGFPVSVVTDPPAGESPNGGT